jgi:hypothetical protein
MVGNPNLLLDDAAEPVLDANGIYVPGICMWFGGKLDIAISGVFGGATVDIYACTRLPALGAVTDGAGNSNIPIADWVPIAKAIAAPELLQFEHLNPCLLCAHVNAVAGTTRVRVALA